MLTLSHSACSIFRRYEPELEMIKPELEMMQTEPRNNLLGALSAEVRNRLFPHLDLVELSAGKVLYEPGDLTTHVYFPIGAIVSILYELENGDSAEISMVGKEGLVGIGAFMGGDSTSSREVVCFGGSAYRLSGQHLKDEFSRHGELLLGVLRYIQALITQMAQTAVCNGHHSVEQRLCRWLLLCLDRRDDNCLPQTHDGIARMLSVRREGVSGAAGKLQKLGAIQYSRGHIKVLDRVQLEQYSCECYSVVKQESDRLLRYPSRAKNQEPRS